MSVQVDPGSFRDPSGHVYHLQDRVYRTINPAAAAHYETARDSGCLAALVERGLLIASQEVDKAVLGAQGAGATYVVEHPKIAFVSYPYEWSFSLLKAAALLHLDLHLAALEHGMTLSDASAYNVQFLGPRPLFVDLLSLRRYREGEFWDGHSQFCHQFLNPLLLRALLGVPHNAWYRGALEGITTSELARLLPLRRKLSWNVFSQVVLQAKMQNLARGKSRSELAGTKQKRLPRSAFRNMLQQLRGWIARLEPLDREKSVWNDYAEANTYKSEEAQAKRRFVADFAAATKPGLLIDLGCNTGAYSEAALEGGARRVIGFDFDQGALDQAFARAEQNKLDFLPLHLDAANPSPDQGWRQQERAGFAGRMRADAIVALAFEHHLAIGRNLPLDQVVDWLIGLAPSGVIEFVQKTDSTVQQMLALREDIFAGYTEPAFTAAIEKRARIVRSETISGEGRCLFWYDRR
ncbi:MAG TPA: class I SAM-dependent methyltransferase [Kiloniellaceae bacterium]